MPLQEKFHSDISFSLCHDQSKNRTAFTHRAEFPQVGTFNWSCFLSIRVKEACKEAVWLSTFRQTVEPADLLPFRWQR